MSRMIDGILAYSRAGLQDIQLSPVDLGALWGVVCEDLEIQIQEAGATLEIGQMPTVEGDPIRLQQVLQNLLSNALKYRSPARPLRVTVEAELRDHGPAGEMCVMTVADNGVGFDPQYASAIFEPFKRLQGRRQTEGIGLGLALCHRIIRLHNGNVEAEGHPGSGAIFRIVLPARQEARHGGS